MATRTAPAQRTVESTAAKVPETGAKKIVETEDVFGQIDRIHNSIARRAFEIFSSNGSGFSHDLDNWFKAESELLHPVHLKVTEHDGAVDLSAEVPGFNARDLEIKLEPNRVTISGKRETNEDRKTDRAFYREHCANEIFRIVDLPMSVDASKAEAKLKNGILEMHMPKGKAAKTARIHVKAN